MNELDSDRLKDASTAWEEAKREASRLGLVVVQPPAPSAELLHESHVVPTSLIQRDGAAMRATGKGIGIRAWASGVFEAFEHGAAALKLPGQQARWARVELEECGLEVTDLRYRYALERRRGRDQPVIAFTSVFSGETVAYPAVAADFGFAISEGDYDLLYLDRTCTTKGYAAGSAITDAETHALNELIEHDALSE